MNGIQLMMAEHQLILRMLNVIRAACYKLLKTGRYNSEDFQVMIDFVRRYADAHHHGKEEQILFNLMVEQLGIAAEKLVTHGMLVEHDLGRLHINQLERALCEYEKGNEYAVLDIIANAIGYTDLLKRHIDKEDRVVYTFAEKNLPQEALETLNHECELFEKTQEDLGIQIKYQKIVSELELKYNA